MQQRSGPSAAVIVGLLLVVALVVVLRNDFWNWEKVRPLAFGFLPIGLWWQAMVAILSSVMMALMVKFAWPGWLEEEANEGEQLRKGRKVI